MRRLSPAVQLLGLGSYLAVCIVGFTIGGVYLDRAAETGRLFTLIGLALGLVVGLFGGYRMLMDTLRDIERWQSREANKK